MAANNRDASIAITLGYEGGYCNNYMDPGGPTNWGITIHDARMYWKRDATASDVRKMPKSVAIQIYREKYWNKMNCDADPAGVDLVTFDYGVNSGIGRAVPCRASCKSTDVVAWVKGICRKRLSFVRGLRTWSVFGRGWGSRIANVEARGVKMALQATPLTQDEIRRRLQKEQEEANKKAGKQAGGAIATGAGGASTQDPSLPHHIDWSLFATSTKWIAGVIITGLLIWVLWHIWHNHQRAEAYAKAAKENA